MTEGSEIAVHVVRPGGGTTRIGPIPNRGVAEDIVASFTSFSTRPERQGVSCAIAVYDPGQDHLPLVPAEPACIAALVDHPDQGFDAPFPNLWDRLVAQHGLGTADRVWKAAMDLGRTGEEVAAPSAPQDSADARFDNNLHLVLSAFVRGDQNIDTAVRDIRRMAAHWTAGRT